MTILLEKILRAGLTKDQIAILFGAGFISTQEISGQGTEIVLQDGAEFIISDCGNYIEVYNKELDIYDVWERECPNGSFRKI